VPEVKAETKGTGCGGAKGDDILKKVQELDERFAFSENYEFGF